MGQIRTAECAEIDRMLLDLCGSVSVETKKDSYSEDYMAWVTADEELHPIRITVEEYADGSWRENLRLAVEALSSA